MSPAGHIGKEVRRSHSVMAGALMMTLALLIGALLLPATAAARPDTRAPRLTVQRLVSEVVPGKGNRAILAYSTDETASIIVVIARLDLSAPATAPRGNRARPLTTEATGRPSYVTPRTPASMYVMDRARGGMLLMLHGENGTVFWDGNAASGDCAPGGTYWVQITATDAAGNTSAPQVFFLTVPELE